MATASTTNRRPHRPVFLFDVDNTLLDNDRVTLDLRLHLATAFGDDAADRYFAIFEELRTELGYADYLGALQRYRLERRCDPRVLGMSSWLVDYPFRDRLYPDALALVARVQFHGTAVILSDGDAVFQPRKIERSGLWAAFHGHVLVYVHKEEMLAEVERRYPAEHYVMFDDKVRILSAFKHHWGPRVTTVFPRQGHYAAETAHESDHPSPDVTLDRIGDAVGLDFAALIAGRGAGLEPSTTG
jgi:FMN phosphatase YigB (HAD superfamily)